MASSLLHCIPNPIPNSPTLLSHSPPHLKSSNLSFPVSSRSRAASPPSQLAAGWREIQGLNNWENLVEPLHPLLRDEIVRYGEFVAACYEAFDLDPGSRRYLNCKYRKSSMLESVGLAESGYEVTKYIYATAPDISLPTIQPGPCSNTEARWIGYVATSSDSEVATLGRRDIVITFRGTVTNPEWMANLMSSLTPARLDPHDPRPEVKVEEGFLSLYTSDERSDKFGLGSCRCQLLSEISRLINKHRDEEVSITIAGHSMGSSLGLLLAYDIAELGLNGAGKIPVTVFSFGGPRVGNTGFKERCEELGVRVLRVVNVNDPITKMPGVVFNENFKRFRGGFEFPWSCSCYAHVGVELLVDFFKMHNPSCVHDLGSYIGLLRGQMKSPESPNLVDRAKGFFAGGGEWREAAVNMFNLVRSQWT
ncbi:galactolipase DONGLE, chloroplastic [Salvia hispanica]|uniref:galactolipase DONGLE, chloroplastic n=1 Tax=Salvia hispanica TaxID=49212 RepID=UPI0020094CF5|nr:galactolipase DONGLE, chloroplastic [Salvia hispanica]